MHSAFGGIPLDAPKKEMSGAVMEALASQGFRTTTHAIFEVAYKAKYNSDTSEKQSKIFDIIRDSVQYDFGKVFFRAIGWQVLNCSDPDRTGLIMETMAAYSMDYVVPAVYKITLQGRGSRDDNSSKMLDIILNNS